MSIYMWYHVISWRVFWIICVRNLKRSVRDKHAMISHDFFAFTSWWQFFQMKDFSWIFQGARVSDDPRERDLQISCEPGRCVGSQNLREMIGRCDIFWSRCQLVGLLSSLLVMFFSVFSIIFCSMKGLLTRSLLRITNHQHQPLLSRWLKLEWVTGASTRNFQNIQNATKCRPCANHIRWIESLLQLAWAVQGSIQPHPCENSLPFKARLNAWLGVVCVIELFWCPPVSFYFL